MSDRSEITVVTERGQVSIPADLRRDLALRKGDKLLWQRVGDRELRAVVLAPGRPAGARAMLGFARRFRATRRTADWMKELREGED